MKKNLYIALLSAGMLALSSCGDNAEKPAEKPAAAKPEEKKGCGSIVSVGAVVAIIALGVVCIKKKD